MAKTSSSSVAKELRMADELDQLRDLGRDLADPDDETVLRARGLLERRIDLARSDREVADNRPTPIRRLGFRSRKAFLLAAALLLVVSAFGFGLASSLTPSGSAGVNFVGFGFQPVRGWNVLQTGTPDESGVARAVAANVQLGAGDDLGGLPRATLASLPDRGVLIFASFKPRGDSEVDAGFVARELPLQLEDAERMPTNASLGALDLYRLRAAVGGYNIDARVYFGHTEPSAAAWAAAESQLSRLVVASERITIRAQPTVIGPRTGNTRVRVSGVAQGARANEPVAIQAKTCGLDFFRVIGGAVTDSDGSWWNYVYPTTLTTLRVVWRDEASAEVTVRREAQVIIRRRSARSFEVSVYADRPWRKRVTIQRFDNRLGSWSMVQSVLLTDSYGAGARAVFVPKVRKGTLIRGVFPRKLAAPCFLPGISNSVRT
jgi:hypothetical protein